MMDRMEKEVELYNDISLILDSDSKFKFVKSIKELEDAIVNSDIARFILLKGVTHLTENWQRKE